MSCLPKCTACSSHTPAVSCPGHTTRVVRDVPSGCSALHPSLPRKVPLVLKF